MTPDERVTELEVKLAFHERWVAELDEVVRALRDQVDELGRELRDLSERVRPEEGSAVDEKPPHY
ncbi:MAG: SlyX family protein [Myxococcota bacterium]